VTGHVGGSKYKHGRHFVESHPGPLLLRWSWSCPFLGTFNSMVSVDMYTTEDEIFVTALSGRWFIR
jgi:hypothetical protein